MITKQDLAAGIRFAGERAATAGEYAKDWDHQLGHQWTTGDALRHVAASVGGLERVYPMLANADVLSGLGIAQIGAMNAQSIAGMKEKSREEVLAAIRDGSEASAKFAETLNDEDLATVVKLGGYEMPKGEIAAQIWIHHTIAHAYEASARWPIQ
ncbi:MAG: hypothetical protein WD557_15880 [Dehalococcoidia bacterium]